MSHSPPPASNVRSLLTPACGLVPTALLCDPAVSSHAKVIFGIVQGNAGRESLTLNMFAERLGVSVPTAQRALYELRDLGWIEVIPHSIDGRQVANEYRLNLRRGE